MKPFEVTVFNVNHGLDPSRKIQLLEEARSDLTVFPELFLDLEAMRDPDGLIERMAGRDSVVVFGARWENHNSAFVAGRGKVRRYDKVHLTRDDISAGLERGSKFQVFDLGFARIGVAICHDIQFPESFRTLVSKGAEVVVVPALWPSFDTVGWDSYTRVRCRENQVFGVFSNGTGTFKHLLCGYSRVVSPMGSVIVNVEPLPRDADSATVRLDPELLDFSRGKGWEKENYWGERVPSAYEF